MYSLENLVIKNEHSDADKFEKYTGSYSFDGEIIEKVNLILYKSTKIIHSLYPQNKKYNKNKNKTKCPYTRGQVKVTTDRFLKIQEIFVPFLDINMKQKYGLLIDQTKADDIEDWNIFISILMENTKVIYFLEPNLKVSLGAIHQLESLFNTAI